MKRIENKLRWEPWEPSLLKGRFREQEKMEKKNAKKSGGPMAPWGVANSRAGAGREQDEPETSCARKQGNVQRMMGQIQRTQELEVSFTGQICDKLSIKTSNHREGL